MAMGAAMQELSKSLTEDGCDFEQAAKQSDSPSRSATTSEILLEGMSEGMAAHRAMPEDERARAAVTDALESWERVLATAAQSNREALPDILKNALTELFAAAEHAELSHTEISDWAVGVGELHSIATADTLQDIIVDA